MGRGDVLHLLAYKGCGHSRIIMALVKDRQHRAVGFQVEPSKGDCIGSACCADIHEAVTCCPPENSVFLDDETRFDSLNHRKYLIVHNKRFGGGTFKWEITEREFIELMFLFAPTSKDALKRIRQNQGIGIVVVSSEFICTKHNGICSCRCVKRNTGKLKAAQKYLDKT